MVVVLTHSGGQSGLPGTPPFRLSPSRPFYGFSLELNKKSPIPLQYIKREFSGVSQPIHTGYSSDKSANGNPTAY